MDMMHSLVFAVPPKAPTGLTGTVTGTTTRRVALSWTDNSVGESQFTIQRATDANFTTGLRTFNFVNPATTAPNTARFTDNTVSNNTRYYYRVAAVTVVGDTQTYAGSSGFPTMSAESISNVITVNVGTPGGLQGAPTNLQAAVQAGPQVNLTWTDGATNETGFAIERCSGTTCTNFAQIATAAANSVSYLDAAVVGGTTYRYRVKAVNGAVSSAYAPTTGGVQAVVPAAPAAATSFNVSIVKVATNNWTANLSWAHNGVNVNNFTIERATNSTFTSGLVTLTAGSAARSLQQTGLASNTTYYYRIRANNSAGNSSAWRNALPNPIRTGP
jgi:hypothetical protein